MDAPKGTLELAQEKAAELRAAMENGAAANRRLCVRLARMERELDALKGKSGPVEQLRHVKPKLRAVVREFRAMQAAATETIATQAQAIAAAGKRVVRLEEALGPDLAGRPFSELLVQAADALDAAGGGPLADCLRAKAGEVECVQPDAVAPVLTSLTAA